jgi:hypothetical protein
VRALRIAAPVAVLLLLPAVAPAQVFVDPDSPTAKEYAIPLESERRQADPDVAPGEGVVQGERSSPLFGVGIEPGSGSPSARESQSDASGGGGTASGEEGGGGAAGSGRGTAAGASDPASSEPPDVVQAASANPGAPDGGIGTPLLIAGVAVAVLAVGGAAGFLLRRRA